ncbi:hypothetical protein DL765_003492 [Monosporascus sp. GIB2]|nr:hypothetical protein DL765_003492 [Monosporascus sp. GIB2]
MGLRSLLMTVAVCSLSAVATEMAAIGVNFDEEDAASDAGNNNGNNANDENCGFPNGPDCVSLGEGASGLEQFADDGFCLLPFRCGNGDGGERCERVAVGNNNKARLRRVPRGASVQSGEELRC